MNSLSLKEQFRLYRRALVYIKPQWRYIAVAGVLSIILGITNGLATYSFLPVFDLVLHSGTAGGSSSVVSASFFSIDVSAILSRLAGSGTPFLQLVRLVGFIVGLTLVSNFLMFAVDGLFAVVQAAGTKRLRKDVFAHLIQFPLHFYTQEKTGSLISRIDNDIGGTIALVAKSISDVVLYSFLSAAYVTILFWLHAQLVLLLIPALVVIGIVTVVIGHWVRVVRRRMLALQADIVSHIHEVLSGIKMIKAYTAEPYERGRWGKFIERARRLEIATNLNKVIPLRFNELVTVLLSASVVLAGGWLVTRGTLAGSELLVFFLVLVRFQKPAAMLSQQWFQIQNGMAYAQRAFDLIDQREEKNLGALQPLGLQQRIAFEHVSFSYAGQPVLHDVSFVIPHGSTVALVGPSGSGKTTIIDLLLRFYLPTHGMIALDGANVADYALQAYRSLFGVVTQDTFLFHDTVRNNISYGLSAVSHSAVMDAALVAHAHEFISSLPEGYDTVIGDRGVRLSGGQRQRLALARAIIRSPQILVLDEATSSLDSDSEAHVQQAIDTLIEGRTVLLVAHRLSTVVHADQIFVVNEGRIVEQGTHDELLAYDGLYRHLWLLQTGSYAKERVA